MSQIQSPFSKKCPHCGKSIDTRRLRRIPFSGSLSWALAFLSTGIGLFLLVGRLPALSKVAVAFLLLSGVLAVVPSAREFLAKDSCLDAGGKWSARELRCAYE
jgi:uncharacterized membrane protein YphA (DoxX/SURF4 family)